MIGGTIKMLKRTLALLLSLVLVFSIVAGCANNNNQPTTPTDTTPSTPSDSGGDTTTPAEPSDKLPFPADGNLTTLFSQVTDSSELPDWPGEVLDLTHWYGHGLGHSEIVTSANDVYWPEIERIFGIRLNPDSFDNGGVEFEERMSLLAATGDWPHIGTSIIQTGELIREGLLHDLTDLMPIYAPHYFDFISRNMPESTQRGYMNSGRLYGFIDIDNDLAAMQTYYPDLDPIRYQYVRDPWEWSMPYYVRDDVLKLMYPDARSQDEIEALFMEQGYFTRDQVYDIPINSKQDAIDFLYKAHDVIAEHGLTEGGRPLKTTYITYGNEADIWPLMMYIFAPLNGWSTENWNYFLTFNNNTKEFERQFATDFFRDEMRMFNQLVRDGIADPETIVMTQDIFEAQVMNGEFAVCYVWWIPDDQGLKDMGKDYRYRKVYFNIEHDTSTYLDYKSALDVTRSGVSIFTTVPEENVPQIMMFLDFLYSDVGMRLQLWGPRTAGLFTENPDGTRRYTDPELEAAMVFGEPNGRDDYFNLSNGDQGREGGNRWHPPAWPYIATGIRTGGKWHPAYHDYDMTQMPRDPSMANKFFSSALFMDRNRYEPAPVKGVYPWFHFEIEEVQNWWAAREAWEHDAMKRVVASRNDDEFDRAFQRVIDISEENGMTEQTLRMIEQNLKDNFPEDWEAYMTATRIN